MVYKIIVFPFLYVGHSNPMIKIVNELIKTYNSKVIVYSIDNFKQQIELTGAEYRRIDDISYDYVQKPFNNIGNVVQLFKNLFEQGVEMAEKYTLHVAREIVNEKPDLILYDTFCLYVRFAYEMLHNNYKNRSNLSKTNNENIIIPTEKPPPAIVYWTTFIGDKGIYPNEIEKKLQLRISNFEKLGLVFPVIKFIHSMKKIAKRYNVSTEAISMDNLGVMEKDKLNIVLIFPELHPKAHLFDKEKVKFVGACVSDEVHITGAKQHDNSDIDELLKKFQVINPPKYSLDQIKISQAASESSLNRLIYVSLGTVYNENICLYTELINAFVTFDNQGKNTSNENSLIKSQDLTIIFSLGETTFKYFQKKIDDKQLTVPENLILKRSVPQLEILKRASLFITHSGMNSTNEAVHYGVPMICIPLMGDQTGNAYRVATELGLGIMFDYKTVKSADIKKAIQDILTDKSFYDRCSLYSSLSQRYNGPKNCAKIVTDFINEKRSNN